MTEGEVMRGNMLLLLSVIVIVVAVCCCMLYCRATIVAGTHACMHYVCMRASDVTQSKTTSKRVVTIEVTEGEGQRRGTR